MEQNVAAYAWYSMSMMTRVGLLLTLIACAMGCDAVSSTQIVVRQGSYSSEAPSEIACDVTRVSLDTAAQFGLVELGRRETDVSFGEKEMRQNPHLWLTIKLGEPVGVELAELYVSTPTERHRQLADALVQNLVADGLDAEVVYQTNGSYKWYWVLAMIVVVLVVARRALRRRGNRMRTPSPNA